MGCAVVSYCTAGVQAHMLRMHLNAMFPPCDMPHPQHCRRLSALPGVALSPHRQVHAAAARLTPSAAVATVFSSPEHKDRCTHSSHRPPSRLTRVLLLPATRGPLSSYCCLPSAAPKTRLQRAATSAASSGVRAYAIVNNNGCTGLNGGPACFLALHERQAGTIFAKVCEPPFTRGMICSCSRRFIFFWQYAQRYP